MTLKNTSKYIISKYCRAKKQQDIFGFFGKKLQFWATLGQAGPLRGESGAIYFFEIGTQ